MTKTGLHVPRDERVRRPAAVNRATGKPLADLGRAPSAMETTYSAKARVARP